MNYESGRNKVRTLTGKTIKIFDDQKMYSSVTICLILLSAATVGISDSTAGDYFNLRILHTNDMHARFEQVSQSAGKCSEYEAVLGLCYGGFARVRTSLKEEFAKAQRENISVLSLNAGDSYQGTVWYSIYKWKAVSHFMKMLKIDAMSLGNHEFDDGIKGLVPFLNDVGIPVLACNIDYATEPELAKTPLKSHMTFEKEGRKIGVIGYLTPDTAMLANTGTLNFTDEIKSLTEQAKLLKKMNVDIIIAVGHSGYEMDLRISEEVPDVDVVVGGHSHTFLYTGPPPDSDKPLNVYPVMVTQKTGRKVAMVQAYAFTKYLGKLDLIFDRRGELVKASGNPILLNYKIPEDMEMLKEVKEWKSRLDSTMRERIGRTKVQYDSWACRFFECPLGNLITDSYVHHAVKNHFGPYWTDAAIAIQQAGGIRAPINGNGKNGNVTREDVITTMPFFSSLSIVKVKGVHLLEALEWSVARYDPALQLGRGEFLQVSGLKVIYNTYNPVGSRVVSVKVRCASCPVPKYSFLSLESEYKVIMPTFIYRGGDNFTVFKKYGEEVAQMDASDTNVTMKFIEENDYLYNGVEGRIEFRDVISGAGLPSKINFIYLPLVLLLRYFN